MKKKKQSRNKSTKRQMISQKNVCNLMINVAIGVSESGKKQTKSATNWKIWFVQVLLSMVLKKIVEWVWCWLSRLLFV